MRITRMVALCVTALVALAQADLNRFVVQRDGKYGYINRAGKIVIPLQYNNAYEFAEDLAPVHIGGEPGEWGSIQGGKWGFMAEFQDTYRISR